MEKTEYADLNHSSRRSFLQTAGTAAIIAAVPGFAGATELSVTDKLLVTGIQLHVLKVNQRGNWYFIELTTSKGIKGLGECSHAAPLSPENDRKIRTALTLVFGLIKDQSPFNIEQFRQRSFIIAQDKITQTVFSGIEQALWDINGKALGTPVYNLLGGKVRDRIRAYANINRASNERGKDGRRAISSFQHNAERALQQGFTAVKLAPFDEMRPLLQSSPTEIEEDIAYAINCIAQVRSTIGKETALLIDVHSHLDKELSVLTAKRLQSSDLFWFEEPVNPARYPHQTREIKDAIPQVLAGGEAIFGRTGFAELLSLHALGIIMPDVKHCGGILELKFIAAAAEANGNVLVAPHNPSGPLATAASAAVCATLTNFSILEYAFGEVPWSNSLITPAEEFTNGHILVSDQPGLGHELNYSVIKRHI